MILQTFDNLVSVSNDGEPRASSYVIAAGMLQQHRSILQLVRRHESLLSEFGRVAFEVQPFQTAGGTQYRDVAMLNEQQATLLISFMRNSAKVRDFKVALVKEFYRMRDALHMRDLSLWERRLRLETRDASSAAKASVGSKLMLGRKRELPDIRSERALLQSAQQPSLLTH